MPVIGRVTSDTRRLTRIITNVRRMVDTDDLLESVDLDSYGDRALRHLRNKFPRSKSRRSHSLKEFGMFLFQGWQVNAYHEKSLIGFDIRHVLEGTRADVVLRSLDEGSKAFDFVVAKSFAFPDLRPAGGKGKRSRKRYTTIAKGTVIHRSARPGSHYIESTYDFIIDRMLPQLKDAIQVKAKKMLEN